MREGESDKLLEVRNLRKHFGGVVVLQNIDIDVSESEIVGIIGPNGAGKTTLFNIIAGFFPPSGGKVIFRGEEIIRVFFKIREEFYFGIFNITIGYRCS